MKFRAFPAILAIPFLLAGCAGLVDERLTERTGLTKEERCESYRQDIASYELAASVLGKLDPERQARLDALKRLQAVVCLQPETR